MATAALAALGVAGYGRWVSHAPSTGQPAGDAVVVHAGSRERLAHAFDLMDADTAPTLVLIGGAEPWWRRANHLCGQQEPYEIVCPTPDPINTIGEARALSRLVGERGWTSVVVVSSDYHLRRATHLDRRCSGIEVVGSAAASGRPLRSYLPLVAKEMLAMVRAVVVC